ncbi:DUF2268 domain-containing protein [Bacillus massilinigeriensis]|uniref:DUF2268 domain-containing protein n=1 Tax=Bacillus massilionigeriensis TaxID=1805475 RepID=UPI00096ADC91|nr:DUF2268 domain-containing putative Zn-dependent protease [Bacillus massilionigeriensis]
MRTDEWLDQHFNEPEHLCDRLLKSFSETDSRKLYQYLMKHGMYRPNRSSWLTFHDMKEKQYWGIIDNLYEKYRKEWEGPDIPIYLFPIQSKANFIFRGHQNKSGVSFHDKMFLFITPLEDRKEIEALFVHEYHHVCRLNKNKKNLEKYTLLDSIILEGLAENAVREHCGKQYCAKWCSYYTSEQLLNFWKKYFLKNLSISHRDELHEKILYGIRPFPRLVGYGLGYEIVARTYKLHPFSTKASFILPSEYFIKRNDLFHLKA